MDASSCLDFGLDSGRDVSFEHTGLGMDCGLPDFPIPVRSESSVSTVEGNIVSYSSCITTNVLSKPVSSSREVYGHWLRPKPPPNTQVEFTELERQKQARDQRSISCYGQTLAKKSTIYCKKFRLKFMSNPPQ